MKDKIKKKKKITKMENINELSLEKEVFKIQLAFLKHFKRKFFFKILQEVILKLCS